MAGANIKGITIEIGGETTKLDSALKGINTTTKTLQTQLKAVDQALKLDPKNTELVAQKQETLAAAISATKEKLETLKTAQEQAAEAFERGEISEDKYRALQTEITKTETELKKLESQLEDEKTAFEKVGEAVQDAGKKLENAGEKIEKVGDSISSAGKALTPVTAGLTAVGTAAVTASVDFEDAIAKLDTIADTSEETGVPLEELKTQIKDLSDQTGISASEIADNVYNAISAGLETGDAVNFVAQSTKLATAGFADSGGALDLLTTILNAYGMEASEVSHVSDVLINTQNKGKTTVAELSSAMGKVIPTANAANVSLENLAAGYAVMTANGIATAETTTYMNSMLNELSKSGTTASDTIKSKTGKSFQDLMADGASLADVLQILQEQAEEDGVAMNDMFGSAEAGKAAMTLLSGGVDEFNASVAEMTDGVDGASDEAFSKLETTSRKASIALNEVKNAGIELGDTILEMVMPYFDKFTQKIKDVTTWFKNLDDSQKQMIVKIAAIVAAVAPALLIGGKVVSTVGKVTSGIGKVTKKVGGLISKMGGLPGVMSALASPVGIVIAAIAALAAAFVYLYNTNDEFRDKVNAAVEKIKASFSGMVEKVKPLLDELKEAFSNLMTTLQPIFEFILTFIMSIVNGIINAVAPIIAAITNVVGVVTNIIQALFALLSGDTDGFFSYIEAALQNAVNFVTNIITAIVNFIIGFFEGFGVDIKQIFTDIWNGIVSIFSGVGTWFSGKFTEAYTAITSIFQNIGQWFNGRYTEIKVALSTVGTWFQTTFQTAYKNVTNAFKDIGSWFKTNVVDRVKSVFDSFSLAEAGTRIMNSFVNAIKSVHIPKLTIEWGTAEKTIAGLTVTVPVPSISWNAAGGIMTNPTLFGMYGGKLQGGGEAGDEAILPLDIFYKRTEGYIDDAIARATAAVQNSGGKGGGDYNQYISIQSPEALSAYEVARQTRNQTRNLVLQIQKGKG